MRPAPLLLALLFAACGREDAFEDAALEVARAIGLGGAEVVWSQPNMPRMRGRTVALRIPGNEMEVALLSIREPGLCEDGPCPEALREAVAKAERIAEAARAVEAAFVPCDLQAIDRVSVFPWKGTMAARVWLPRGGAPDDCAAALAAAGLEGDLEVRRIPVVIDPPRAPKLSRWSRTLMDARLPSHPRYRYVLGGGEAAGEAPMLIMPSEEAGEAAERAIGEAASAWLARNDPDARAGVIYAHGPYQTLLPDGRIRVLVALEDTDRGLAVSYDPGTGEAGDVAPLDGIRDADGLLRAEVRDRL